VVIVDQNGKTILPKNCNSTVKFIAGDPVAHEGEGFAQLNLYGIEGINLPSVPYLDAYNSQVSYVANANEYLGIFPLRITLWATVVINGSPISHSVVVTLMGDNTKGKYFPQDDTGWASEYYDHSTIDKIQKKGCLLIDFAMILTAFGVDVNPKTLNDWMNKDLTRWNDEDVKWSDLETYDGDGGSTVKVAKDVHGLGIDQNKDGSYNFLLREIPDLGAMDASLLGGYPVLAQVLNVDHPHWILVTGKTSTGDYTILDPGKRERVTLGSSYKTIYKYNLIVHK
jgi:hypothetical protein